MLLGDRHGCYYVIGMNVIERSPCVGIRINDNSSFHRLFVDPLSRAMFSSNGRDFEFLQARREAGGDIHDAIYELALRNFPDEMKELEAWTHG